MVAALMSAFAERTGLTSDRPARRYLWTDAFAVCNYLGLARSTGDARPAELALELIDRVHHTLGRHRPDDPRTGWISGLDERRGEAHPTRGGLRIGKMLPERALGEPFDEALEWERDGQYFHYLTKWMHALDQAARFTGRPTLHAWSCELAEAARRAFVHDDSTGRRMHWKMSIDLSRPLVTSMGQHDALDGYVTCAELHAASREWSGAAAGPDLREAMADFASMIDPANFETDDPLGLGGLLTDAHRVQQLAARGAPVHVRLIEWLLEASLSGLRRYARANDVARPAARRLAFRELGFAIGLHAAHAMRTASRDGIGVLDELARFDPLRAAIVDFWAEPEHRSVASWLDHRDINDVMLATALAPEGFLVLEPRAVVP